MGPLLSLLLAACAGVAPNPASVSADSLPVRTLDDQARNACVECESEAVAAVVSRDYSAAAAAAERALALDPRSARGHAVLGMVAFDRASAVEPVDYYELRRGEALMALAQQLGPYDAFVGWIRAVFLAESGHLSAAAVAAEQALERCIDAPAADQAALLGIAGTYRYELGEERAAFPHLQAYTSLRPRDATAHFRLGASLLVMSKTPQGVPPPYRQAQAYAEQSVDAFRRCVELAPGDEDAWLSIAAAQLRAAELARLKRDGDADERAQEAAAYEQQALDHLTAVTERFADSAEARFRLGVVAGRLGRDAASRAAYEAALARDPDHAGSLMNLAAAAVAAEDVDAARLLFERLLAADERRRALTSDERESVEAWLAK